MTRKTCITLTPMAMAIATHRAAHERYRLLSAFTNMTPPAAEGWQAADDACTTANEQMDEAFRALGNIVPENSADLGSLSVHLRMILEAARHSENDFAPFGECFDVLQSACAAFAGRPA